MSVYQSFPPNKFQIKYAFTADFNLTDEFIGVGNDEGRVLLYKYIN